MTRTLLSSYLCLGLAMACSEPRLVRRPLPPAAAPTPVRAGTALGDCALLIADESLTWDVSWHGMRFGRAQLRVSVDGDTLRTHSRFRNGGLAARIEAMSHELNTTTDLATALPRSSRARYADSTLIEVIEADYTGANYRVRINDGRWSENQRDGDPVHTAHTALAVIRAWARVNAHPGQLRVLSDNLLYLVELSSPRLQPVAGSKRLALRIDGHALPPVQASDYGKLAFTMWLTTDQNKTPLRIEVVDSDGDRMVAELIE